MIEYQFLTIINYNNYISDWFLRFLITDLIWIEFFYVIFRFLIKSSFCGKTIVNLDSLFIIFNENVKKNVKKREPTIALENYLKMNFHITMHNQDFCDAFLVIDCKTNRIYKWYVLICYWEFKIIWRNFILKNFY